MNIIAVFALSLLSYANSRWYRLFSTDVFPPRHCPKRVPRLWQCASGLMKTFVFNRRFPATAVLKTRAPFWQCASGLMKTFVFNRRFLATAVLKTRTSSWQCSSGLMKTFVFNRRFPATALLKTRTSSLAMRVWLNENVLFDKTLLKQLHDYEAKSLEGSLLGHDGLRPADCFDGVL